MKEYILKGSSCYQIGGQPGHRSLEHLFSVKSIIAKKTEEGKVLIGGVHDISKFFAKEVLSDVLQTLTDIKNRSEVCSSLRQTKHEHKNKSEVWRRIFLLDGGGRHLRTGIGRSRPSQPS